MSTQSRFTQRVLGLINHSPLYIEAMCVAEFGDKLSCKFIHSTILKYKN